MFSQVVKTLLTKKQSSVEDKIETLHRTCFLYFFQLLGIKEDDEATLDTLFGFLKSNKKELTKAQMDSIKFDAQFFTFNAPGPVKTKAQLAHLRAFKKFCKVLVSNIVDVFPSLQESMSGLVSEILKFTNCKLRLFRHGFTQIGLTIFNELLVEGCKLQTLKVYFTGQRDKNEQERGRAIELAIDFFLNKNAARLGEELMVPRLVDSQDFIRKGVYDCISELGPSELKLACSMKKLQLISRLFKGINDEDACVAAMQALQKISMRIKVTEDQAQRKALEKSFN